MKKIILLFIGILCVFGLVVLPVSAELWSSGYQNSQNHGYGDCNADATVDFDDYKYVYDYYSDTTGGFSIDADDNIYVSYKYSTSLKKYDHLMNPILSSGEIQGGLGMYLDGDRIYASRGHSIGRGFVCYDIDTLESIWGITYPSGEVHTFRTPILGDGYGNVVGAYTYQILKWMPDYNAWAITGYETHVASADSSGNLNWDVQVITNTGATIDLAICTGGGQIYTQWVGGVCAINQQNGGIVANVTNPIGGNNIATKIMYVDGICIVEVPAGIYAFDTTTFEIVWTNTIDTDLWSYNRDTGWLYLNNHRCNPITGVLDVGYEIEGLYSDSYSPYATVISSGNLMYAVRNNYISVHDLTTGSCIKTINTGRTPVGIPAILGDGSVVMAYNRYTQVYRAKIPDITITKMSLSPTFMTGPGVVNYEVTLGGSDPVPVYILWTFGDGGQSNTLAGNHVYTANGDYTVHVVVENQYGITATGDVDIAIRPIGEGYSLADTAWPVRRHDLANTGSSDAHFVPTGDIEIVFVGSAPDYIMGGGWPPASACLNVVTNNDELIYTAFMDDYALLKICPDGYGITEAWLNEWGENEEYRYITSGNPAGGAPCVVNTPYGEGVIGTTAPADVAPWAITDSLDSGMWMMTGSGEAVWTKDYDSWDLILYNPIIFPNGMGGVQIGPSASTGMMSGLEADGVNTLSSPRDWYFSVFDPSTGADLYSIEFSPGDYYDGDFVENVMDGCAYGEGKLYFTMDRWESKYLRCYDLASGSMLWESSAGRYFHEPGSDPYETHLEFELESSPILDISKNLIYVVTMGYMPVTHMAGDSIIPVIHNIESYDADTGQPISKFVVYPDLIYESEQDYSFDVGNKLSNGMVALDESNQALYVTSNSGLCKINLVTNTLDWSYSYGVPYMDQTNIAIDWQQYISEHDLDDDYYGGVMSSGVVVDGLGNAFVTVVGIYEEVGVDPDTGYPTVVEGSERSGYSALGIDKNGDLIFNYPFASGAFSLREQLSDPVILSDGSVVFAVASLRGGDVMEHSYVVTAYSSWGVACPSCDPNYVSPDHIDKYPGWGGITTLPWDAIDGDEVTFNGKVEWGGNEPTDLWFSVGSKSNSYGYKTKYPITAIEGGNFAYHQLGYPLVSNETFFFRAGCEYGYGQEIKCTVMERPAYNQTDLGTTESQRFTHSYHDNGANIIEDIVTAVNNPYVIVFGPYFVVLVLGAILVNLAMRGNSLILPGLLVLLCGGTLYKFLPPEGMMFAQMFMIMGLTGMIYWLLTRNR